MKNSELVKVWALPDNSRVTSKQLSFRLPVHVAEKTRTEIIGDLLTSALEKIEYSFPSVMGEYFGMDDELGNWLYCDVGKGKSFRELVNQHYVELEKELSNENPNKPYDSQLLCVESDIEK